MFEAGHLGQTLRLETDTQSRMHIHTHTDPQTRSGKLWLFLQEAINPCLSQTCAACKVLRGYLGRRNQHCCNYKHSLKHLCLIWPFGCDPRLCNRGRLLHANATLLLLTNSRAAVLVIMRFRNTVRKSDAVFCSGKQHYSVKTGEQWANAEREAGWNI